MDSEKIETAANINGANLEKKIVGKTSAQRQKEYRERKKLQKQLQGPKKVPKTNAQCQQQYRLKQKQRLQLNETLNLARKQSDAVRAKRYRDKLKLKKLRGEFDSVLFSKKDSFENREVNYLQNTNPTSFTSFEVPINGHNECSTLNVPLHHEIDIAGVAMSENSKEEDIVKRDIVKREMTQECRACLHTISSESEAFYIFQTWVPPWEGLDNTVAEALQSIAQIQVSEMDAHSKVLCEGCYHKLHSASLFATQVQQSDQILRQRHAEHTDQQTETAMDIDKTWPKPIQVDKAPMEGQMEIEVKQEVVTDDEGNNDEREDAQPQMGEMDIKIEPEELTPQNNFQSNGCYEGLGTEDSTPDLPSLNGDDSCSQDRFSVTVKEEPVSDNEEHVAPDMSLDCMLCTKVFNSVSGLKAHVIAQHSYKTVKRKAANEASPTKKQKQNYVCETCRRSFSTSTDLMVHETCHNKSVCYGCNEKFDTFEMVMQHRLTCKAVNGREQVPVKTLEDVQRPNRPASNESDVPEPQLKCEYCDEKFSDDYYMKIHLEIHHRAGRRPSASEMEVEALESLFSERA